MIKRSKDEVFKEMEDMVSRINDDTEFNSSIDNLMKELDTENMTEEEKEEAKYYAKLEQMLMEKSIDENNG